MTTQTRRVYVSTTSLRPEACFEVTRIHDACFGLPGYAAELISGDVDCDELEDAECAAIEQAKEEWAWEHLRRVG